MKLEENERIDDLNYNNLKIIQNKEWFCFGIDSIILTDFAKDIKEGSKVVDLGTGSGILSILLCEKTKLAKVIGVEVQKEVAEMANKSIELNNLRNKFYIINEDIKNILNKNIIEKNSIDAVVMNPPYKEANRGVKNTNDKKIIARHETTATLEDFIYTASVLLKDKGVIYIVHKPEKMVDIIEQFRKYKIEPKEIQVVYSRKNKDATLILIKAIKGANKFLKIKKPLYIYDENCNYTDEIKRMYNIDNYRK